MALLAGQTKLGEHSVLKLSIKQQMLYRVGKKSKLLILSEYVNKTEKIGGI